MNQDIYVTKVGTDQTLTKPLLDAETGGITRLCAGPAFRRNNVRFFARMPSAEEAERLPAPMGYDRKSITFSPFMLVLNNPIPYGFSMQFYRVTSNGKNGKIGQKKLHQWSPQTDLMYFPSLPITVDELYPGQLLDLHGISYWHHDAKAHRGKVQRQVPSFLEPPPVIATYMPCQILVLIKMTWIPLTSRRREKVEYVRGSPLDAPPDPTLWNDFGQTIVGGPDISLKDEPRVQQQETDEDDEVNENQE